MKCHQSVPPPDGSGEWGKAVRTSPVAELVDTHLYPAQTRAPFLKPQWF